jgi:Glutamate decarboxylase and related PLP-dependent proteins
VDACVGGFILPFFEGLGLDVPPFDFRVEGVSSISADVHKYGYSPKGASVVLFRNAELKKESIFVDVSNPGYVFVNTAVLSSRSVGPLAAAYATISPSGETTVGGAGEDLNRAPASRLCASGTCGISHTESYESQG